MNLLATFMSQLEAPLTVTLQLQMVRRLGLRKPKYWNRDATLVKARIKIRTTPGGSALLKGV